ncbi:hypothetical protein BT96DRAFT_942824 [Gymnopus androsaceus JB14]|uniref:Uncharacterized protein n=1 Tax=Gymnopus androsaceus JB14 TaxID=1447944 RepID=A0A6A4HCC0_9AGAR|nr:hypothetical protein BT96DRAFT_942824 [Gymnopus androsaceus JB14]
MTFLGLSTAEQWYLCSGTRRVYVYTGTRNAVLCLKLVKDSQLLVSQMNGELCTYDTRFPVEGTSTRTFNGHLNSVTQKLGVCVDPAEDFAFRCRRALVASEGGRNTYWESATH